MIASVSYAAGESRDGYSGRSTRRTTSACAGSVTSCSWSWWRCRKRPRPARPSASAAAAASTSGSGDCKMSCSSRMVTGRFKVKSTASSAAARPVVSRTSIARFNAVPLSLLGMHGDLRERGGLRHASLTDSNQLQEREEYHHRLQSGSRVMEDGGEVQLWLMGQHLPKVVELVGQRHMFHFERHLIRGRQPVQHLLERRGERVQAHLHAGLRDHLRLEQAGEGKPSAGVSAHQRVSQLLETLVLFQPSLDRFFPGRKVLLRLRAQGVRHQAGGFELDQTRANHEEGG